MTEIPKQFEIGERTTVYKTWSCMNCKDECLAVPLESDPTNGRPKVIAIICKTCVIGFKLPFVEYQSLMAAPKV